MNKRNFVALIHALSGAAALIASVMTRHQIGIPEQPIKTIGYAVFALGCLIFVYSLLFLRGAFTANVDPVSEKLVTGGPYRLVRHPVYLAMLVMCLGLAVGLRSWLGIALITIVFLPSTVYRARLGEAALDQKFGEEWRAYRQRSHFILPFNSSRAYGCLTTRWSRPGQPGV
jgi:protein-S-isoprenylcysteine O-methyltransferase Ste14